MNDYLRLFSNNLLPIFLAAGAGYLLARWQPINPRTLSTITFYVFSPCLVFNLLTTTRLSNNDITRIVLFTVACISSTGLVAWLVGRALRLERGLLAAVVMTSMFVNAGNYGLPVVSFAFGETALAFASLVFVVNTVMVNTAGVVIASLGKTSLRNSLINLLKLPTFYAVLLAILILQTGWEIPVPLVRTAKTLGDASIPALMILLGVQFHSIQLKGKILPLSLASSVRLLVGPGLALGLSALFGLQGAARQAGVLEAAMPAAVLNTVLATQFDTEPSFVSAVVVVTTLFSIFTLTPLLAFLGG
ncbi:MAG: AEC family transporter [Anaerolineales bacterium]|nr:AEC family transporter [Anaerolineales bacterium]